MNKLLESRVRQLEVTITIMWTITILLIIAVFSLGVVVLNDDKDEEDPLTVAEQLAYDRYLMGIDQNVNIYILGDDVEVVEEEPETQKWESMGIFDLTAYCPCSICCGSHANGITASGTTATAGRTIAADTDILPMGTHVMINGHEYIVEDVGGGVNGKHIDIFFNTHEEALSMSTRQAEIYILKED